MKIFIVEDEKEICKELSTLLQKYGYSYESSTDFEHITGHILEADADLVLLDINLPYQDGYMICREIRKQSDVPIIVLTSRNTDFDELMSLNIGADDFISKPYNAQVLIARIQKILKRTYEAQANSVLIHKGLTINLLRATAAYGDKEIDLTKNELGILRLLTCIVSSGAVIQHYGILPSRENPWFQIAAVLLAVGTALFFFSISAVLLTAIQANRKLYLKGLNTFLSRQIGSKIQSDFLAMSVVCGLLTVSICGLSAGISSALTMNETSKSALPYDLNVFADIDVSGETDIVSYLKTRDVDMDIYAENVTQISLFEAEMTYGSLFEGQELNLWHIDSELPKIGVSVISVSDFNRALAMQGKAPVELAGNEFLLNCNYKGTMQYIHTFLQSGREIVLGGAALQPGREKPLTETYWMTSVGNNDRGTFIVPDHIAVSLTKDANVLLVQYKSGTKSDEVLQKMIPIGLEWETEGYRYTEKNMMNGMYYGSCALLVFLCCYIGLIFLLICAALLSLKQLTETADNIYRYGLLQKLGADSQLLFGALFKQTAIFFMVPLLLAGIFSAFGVGKIIEVVEEFMNMHISANIGVTVLMFLIVYGGYFIATYLSCKHMVMEKQIDELEV